MKLFCSYLLFYVAYPKLVKYVFNVIGTNLLSLTSSDELDWSNLNSICLIKILVTIVLIYHFSKILSWTDLTNTMSV